MKSPSIKINIENPCHENWHNMLSAEKGKFCQSCQKTVVDFTRMTNKAIIDHLTNNTGKVCGRIDSYRLNTVLHAETPLKSNFFNKYIAGFLMALGFYNPTIAQQPVNNNTTTQETGKKSTTRISSTNDGPFYVEGNILNNATGNPMPFAQVKIAGTNISVNSDKNGFYRIRVPQVQRNANLCLEVYLKGYETVLLENLDIKQKQLTINVQLQASPEILMGEVMMGGMSIENIDQKCKSKK